LVIAASYIVYCFLCDLTITLISCTIPSIFELEVTDYLLKPVSFAPAILVTQPSFLLSKEFPGLVLLAIGIAFPLACWGMTNWLDQFACRAPLTQGFSASLG
jgi:hypothetical protein